MTDVDTVTKGGATMIKDLLLVMGTLTCWLTPLIQADDYSRLDSFPGRILFIFDPRLLFVPLLALIVTVTNAWMKPAIHDATGTTRWLSRFRYRFCWLSGLILLALLLLIPFPSLTGNMVFLGAPMIAAWAFSLLPQLTRSGEKTSWRNRSDGIIIMILFTGFFWWSGLHYTANVGEHAGDEGHYLIQAVSWYEDGDLDLVNQFENPESINRGAVHISRNSKHDKWYSWHPPGLSFILSATVPLGLIWRHLILGLISGAGLAGLYWLTREIGTSRRHAWVVVIMLGSGLFWGVYSSRALPEVLGATLTIYGLLFCLLQRRYAWSVILPFSICIGFLPWVQTRFLPVAIILIVCFFYHGLSHQETVKARIVRLFFCIFLSCIGLLFYYLVQRQMFHGGTSYPVDRVLFSLPAGLWHSLASDRGILISFPLFACAIAASLKGLADRETRNPAMYALLLFLSVWMTSCGTIWFTGGACLPGRYLLVTVPVLMPFLGRSLDLASSSFRGLCYFLAIVPFGMFIGQLARLSHAGKSFASPYILEYIHPLFQGLAHFFYTPVGVIEIWPAAGLFLAALFLVFLPLRFKQTGWITVAGLIILFGVFTRFPAKAGHQPLYDPLKTAKTLENIKLNECWIVVQGDRKNTLSLFAHSDRFWGAPAHPVKSVTSQDLGTLAVTNWISAPHLPVNDWQGREYRWATIVPPFPAGKGQRAVLIDAEAKGPGGATIAIREGNITHVEREFPADSRIVEVFDVAVRGQGDLYLLVRLAGGDFINHRTAVSPFTTDLLKRAGIDLSASNATPPYREPEPELD